METYITICKIDSQWEFAVWLGKLKQGLCVNLEGGMGREMGGKLKREVGVVPVRYGVRVGEVQKKNETGTLQEQITFNEARRDSREISELTQEKSKYI